MNRHKVQVYSGQIKFLHEYFKDYRDDRVKVEVERLDKIGMVLAVETEMDGEETVQYLKSLFKKTKYGTALHYSFKLLE